MTRKTPYSDKTLRAAENAAIGEKIIAALQKRPMLSAEIQAMFGLDENRLANINTRLLKQGKISRAAVSSKRFMYYHGQTSGEPYKPLVRNPIRNTRYSIPTKTVIVRPFSIAGDEGASYRITMPAAPWEVRA